MKAWKVRRQQICAAEAFAVITALEDTPEAFRGRDIVWFIDNEAACASLVRGASSQEDIAGIAETAQWLCMRLQCRIWYEWVDSASNPSDGLSREGLLCPRYGKLARVAKQPAWCLGGAPLLPKDLP